MKLRFFHLLQGDRQHILSRFSLRNVSSMKKYLTAGPITPEQIAAEIADLGKRKNAGGQSIFLGQVRNDLKGGLRVTAIEYSAYEEMVNKETEKIRKGIFTEFSDVLEIIIIHSVGKVNAGEISLLVIVSAGHRDHAIKACSKVVELIKQKLPVWKQEIFEDDSRRWLQNS
jgi:molybdopterin synthase catalytic subunit